MQATLDARALKPFTRALTCISKYGDEMVIRAGPDSVDLTSMNQSKTAYCRFTFSRAFFQRYSPGAAHGRNNTAGPSRDSGVDVLKCQLQTKSLLSILKHRNTDKSAEKCELTIVEGSQTPNGEVRADEDSFESRLIVRLHCKHGVVKTHRLLLNTPTLDVAPQMRDNNNESEITVQSRAVKEIIEHFPNSKGPKSDPELIWRFDVDEVKIKSMEKGIDSKGKSQLATELSLGSDEFISYDVFFSPITIGFFLREFHATVLLADSLSIPIKLNFTLPAEPLYIDADADECKMLFIIATNQVRGEDDDPQIQQMQAGTHRSVSLSASARKRALEDETPNGRAPPEMRKSMKVVQRADPQASPRAASGTQRLAPSQGSGSRPGDAPTLSAGGGDAQEGCDMGDGQETGVEPLFLASQLSAADVDAIRESGLGIETMNAEDFAAMLDGEGEEVNFDFGRPPVTPGAVTHSTNEGGQTTPEDELEYDELDEDDFGMGPTQLEGSGKKTFRPLFED